jgi:hypothetical protein
MTAKIISALLLQHSWHRIARLTYSSRRGSIGSDLMSKLRSSAIFSLVERHSCKVARE